MNNNNYGPPPQASSNSYVPLLGMFLLILTRDWKVVWLTTADVGASTSFAAQSPLWHSHIIIIFKPVVSTSKKKSRGSVLDISSSV